MNLFQKTIQKEAITNIPFVEKPAEEQKKLNIKLPNLTTTTKKVLNARKN